MKDILQSLLDIFCIQCSKVVNNTVNNINKLLQQELETIPNEKSLSADDIWCEKFYKDTVNRSSGLPPGKHLGSSRRSAMGQFLRMEKKLEKNLDLASEYNSVLPEYLTLGHMSLTTCSEIVDNERYFSFYLPHHAIVKPERTSTKVRVVFNASKRTECGQSLNDIL
ncbi:uncharacterized protein [Musca autumnalis]|uniref:uncharacterized protein n=1 Tax=Musca autumnalis TaxID=221902 RepID=UPI003CF3E79A